MRVLSRSLLALLCVALLDSVVCARPVRPASGHAPTSSPSAATTSGHAASHEHHGVELTTGHESSRDRSASWWEEPEPETAPLVDTLQWERPYEHQHDKNYLQNGAAAHVHRAGQIHLEHQRDVDGILKELEYRKKNVLNHVDALREHGGAVLRPYDSRTGPVRHAAKVAGHVGMMGVHGAQVFVNGIEHVGEVYQALSATAGLSARAGTLTAVHHSIGGVYKGIDLSHTLAKGCIGASCRAAAAVAAKARTCHGMACKAVAHAKALWRGKDRGAPAAGRGRPKPLHR